MAEPKLLPQLTIPTGGYTFYVSETELLTDGDMEAATVADPPWTNQTGLLTKETASPQAGVRWLKLLRNGGSHPYTDQSCLVDSTEYRVRGYARGDGGSGVPKLVDGAGTFWTGTNSTSWQSIDHTWTATGAVLRFMCQTGGINDYCGFDSMTLIETGSGGVDVTAGDYDSILEVCAELETQLQTLDATFAVTCSDEGVVAISCDNDWDVDWSNTDDAFETMLGFAGTETVSGSGPYVLTASRRHPTSFFSPLGIDYDIDPVWLPSRVQRPEDGTAIQYASSQAHTERELRFGLLGLEATKEGGTADDGYGSTINWTGRTLYDFWLHVADRPFRFYPDRSDGTVASPGTEGTEFVTCRRLGDRFLPVRVDPASWAFWDVAIKCVVTGE